MLSECFLSSGKTDKAPIKGSDSLGELYHPINQKSVFGPLLIQVGT